MAGEYAPGALRQQRGAHRAEPVDKLAGAHAQLRGDGGRAAGDVEDVAALEVAVGSYAVVADERGGGTAQQALNLGLRPHVILSLDAFAVGVLRGVEAAVGMAEVAQQVVEGLLRDEPVAGIGGRLVCLEVERRQQGVVVEHLLEVGHEPEGVGGVAGEASAEVVVDAAGGHALERDFDHFPRALLARSGVVAEEEFEGHGLRELGGAAEPAVFGVERRRQPLEGVGRR